MMNDSTPRNGSTRKWRELRAIVIAEEDICWLCDKPVDKTLQHPDPMQPSVDHIVGLKQGGNEFDRSNLRLAHMACNIKKGHTDRERERQEAADELQQAAGLPNLPPLDLRTPTTYRARLEALRDGLEDAWNATPADKRAPIAKQLQDVLLSIEALPEAKGVSELDAYRDRVNSPGGKSAVRRDRTTGS